MPQALKIFLNILLYLWYYAVFAFAAGHVYKWLNWGQISTDPAFYNKFGIVMIFVVLMITILLKKYFYIPLASSEEVIVVEE
jgi:hypothetical protein